MITDGEEDEDEEDDDRDDGENADLSGEAVVGVVDEEEGRGLLMDRSTGSVCAWKCRS